MVGLGVHPSATIFWYKALTQAQPLVVGGLVLKLMTSAYYSFGVSVKLW